MTADATWNYDDSICSDAKTGVQLIDQMVKQLERLGWSPREVFGIHMSLEEAIMNAIKHGNHQVPEKRVQIRAEITPDRFFIRVSDEGKGFRPDDVPDPTLDQNLENSSGRGLMLMRHYMDSVVYNDAGNVVELRKARPAD